MSLRKQKHFSIRKLVKKQTSNLFNAINDLQLPLIHGHYKLY